MRPPVPEYLLASTEVAALVGTNPVRIFRDVAPQDTARPYVVWSVIFGAAENYLAQRPGIDNFRVQIDCWGDDEAQVEDLARAVRDALEGQRVVMIGINSALPDFETSLRRYSFDWSFWVDREPLSSS